VSMKYNALPTACESFTYGEVEDYIVVIPTSFNGFSGDGNNSLQGSDIAFTLYPNPVSRGVLNVKVASANATEYTIYNLVGQMVAKGAFEETIDVSQLQSGMYMLQVTVEGQKLTESFIVE
ncbi:T9SS type A sorting domain-containing protein, partial [Aureisphaera galaxeae]|uniref:T9SS type A sorting domain-containing protein n=1 Tax=Aureisphaera galaxeae TaxID=1538023 RepID=UPI00235037FA